MTTTTVTNPSVSSVPQGASRLLDIDRARGLAIFLVVLGHLVAGPPPEGNAWYITMEKVIYRFHMPFFMFLPGFIMLYTYRGVDSVASYSSYVRKRFMRLAPGFFVFAVAILLGKMAMAQFIHVDDVPESFLQEVLQIALKPGSSAAGSLWFIYVLMELYILFPLLLLIVGGRPALLVPLAAVLYFVPATPWLMIEDLFQYLLFFTLGAIMANHYEQYVRLLDRYAFLFIGVFLLSLGLIWTDLTKQESKLIIGLLSLPAIHALVRLPWLEKAHFLVFWGSLSYAIYLLNTIAIGVAKGVLLQFVSWHGTNFLWIAPLLLIAGLFGSIFVKKFIFPFIPPLDRVTN